MRKRVSLLTSLYLLAYWAAIPAIVNADEKLVDLIKKVKPIVVLIETFDKDNKPIS